MNQLLRCVPVPLNFYNRLGITEWVEMRDFLSRDLLRLGSAPNNVICNFLFFTIVYRAYFYY